jgi:hypothetical protein
MDVSRGQIFAGVLLLLLASFRLGCGSRVCSCSSMQLRPIHQPFGFGASSFELLTNAFCGYGGGGAGTAGCAGFRVGVVESTAVEHQYLKAHPASRSFIVFLVLLAPMTPLRHDRSTGGGWMQLHPFQQPSWFGASSINTTCVGLADGCGTVESALEEALSVYCMCLCLYAGLLLDSQCSCVSALTWLLACVSFCSVARGSMQLLHVPRPLWSGASSFIAVFCSLVQYVCACWWLVFRVGAGVVDALAAPAWFVFV